MAQRGEDFDEFCDENNPRTIQFEDVIKAVDNIKSYISPTPCITSHYSQVFGMRLYHKLETALITGSFKERGALNVLEMLPRDKKKKGVCIASIGNQAMGFCYYGQKMKILVTIVLPNFVPITKIEKCRNLGATVVVHGDTYRQAQVYAKQLARERGLTFINARDHPDILAGYGTLALEILEQVPEVDAIIVPVGSGGLVAAVLAVIKHVRPRILVYGVQPAVIPTMFRSLEAGRCVNIPWRNSVADSLAVSEVGVNSFKTIFPRLDKMILVEEDWIARAVLHLVEKERLVVEGAGACALAAVMANLVPEFKMKHVVCIASGGNIDTILLGRCLDRGRAAEGRIVKFKVGISDTSADYEKLFVLLAKGDYNLYTMFPDRIWVENEIYSVEVKIVCETKGLRHALQLKKMIENAYPNTAMFESEPFSDRKTCPCFIKRS